LQRRLPKRGFRPLSKKEYTLVHLRDLDRFEPDSVVDVQALCQSGLVHQIRDGVKVLSDGDISKPIRLRVHRVSEKAREKIVAAGGMVEEI